MPSASTTACRAEAAAIRPYGGVPPSAETRQYIDKAMALHRRYGAAMGLAVETPAQ
ncbi:hypothetical protein RCH27_01120 [Paracidovorax citrulli]|uniref:hypothetical protein n=1 Tax=Paracidovorax citrulli TaxID=80869 RepID=UPI000307442B